MRIEDHVSNKRVNRLLLIADEESIIDFRERLEFIALRDKTSAAPDRVDIHDQWEEEPSVWQAERLRVKGLRRHLEEPPLILVGLIDNL